MWNERYNTEEYIYGKEPNDFLKESFSHIPKGRILCLAEGEGRNAVFLAAQGYEVTAVDASEVGIEKAKSLAAEFGVEIKTVCVNLADYDLGINQWDGIVSIFCHLHPELRKSLHLRVVKGLKPGGVFLLEAYTPDQLRNRTGGPPDADLMMTKKLLRKELSGLKFQYLEELVRDIKEGRFHNGTSSVVQMIAVNS